MGDGSFRALNVTPFPALLGCGEVGFAELLQALSVERSWRSPRGYEQKRRAVSLECHTERKDALRIGFATS